MITDSLPKPKYVWELSSRIFSTLKHRIDRKNPDKDGLTLEPLIVESKMFQIHDRRPCKLVARELTK